MKADIIPIGNSKGIRIPKALLEQCGFSESVDMEVKNNCLVLSAASPARSNWENAFKAMAAKKDDTLDNTLATAFDESEWEW